MGLGKLGIRLLDKRFTRCYMLYDVCVADTKDKAHLEISNDLDSMEG